MKRNIFEYVLFLFDEFEEDLFECQSAVLLFFVLRDGIVCYIGHRFSINEN